MDNMLYIVAGLVIILLIAVLVLRRQRAEQPISRSANKVASSTDNNRKVETAKPQEQMGLGNSDNSATKFDDLTVAQRFMDQQRYDKAIETLKRGLATKPHNGGLLLKLLSIYALNNQHDDFTSTYNDIVSYGDPLAIDEANQLKAQFYDEQTQTTALLARNSNLQSSASSTDSGLDFNLSGSQASTPHPTNPAKQDALDSSRPADDIFDLTLDDLEADTLSANDDSASNLAEGLDDLESPSYFDSLEKGIDSNLVDTSDKLSALEFGDTSSKSHTPVVESEQMNATETITIKPAKDSFNAIENVDEDFSFNFDDAVEDEQAPTLSSENDTALVTSNIIESTSNNSLATETLDDDLVLDFSDIMVEEAQSTQSHEQSSVNQTSPVASDSFDFDIEDGAGDTLTNNPQTTETINVLGSGVEDTVSQLDALNFDDLSDVNGVENSSDNFESLHSSDIDLAFDNKEVNELENFDNVNFNPEIDAESLNLSTSFNFEAVDNISDISLNTTNVTTDQPVSELNFDDLDLDSSDLDSINMDTDDKEVADTISDGTELRFDDSTPIDDDLIWSDEHSTVNMPTANNPVITDETIATTKTDFAAQFSADFEFVNDLDNSQVTLDLAAKYLELGEYDSAKRLLNEVINQGNSEQQSQAQTLLARTA